MYTETLNTDQSPVGVEESDGLQEAIQHLKDAASRKPQPKVVSSTPGPLDDTDWWQGPLDQVIGRQPRDITQKLYPKTIEETMKATSNIDQSLKEALR